MSDKKTTAHHLYFQQLALFLQNLSVCGRVCVYLPLSRHLYCCASAITNKFALLSASAYICRCRAIYTVHASAITNKFALLSASAQFGLRPHILFTPRHSKKHLLCSRLLRNLAYGHIYCSRLGIAKNICSALGFCVYLYRNSVRRIWKQIKLRQTHLL